MFVKIKVQITRPQGYTEENISFLLPPALLAVAVGQVQYIRQLIRHT